VWRQPQHLRALLWLLSLPFPLLHRPAPGAQGDTQAISHAARAAAVLGGDFAMARADRDAWVRRRLRGSLAAGLRGRRGPDVAHQASSPAAQLQALSFLRGNRLSAAASPLLATPLAPQTDAMAAGPCRVGVAAASVSRCAEAPAAGRCSVGAPAAAVAGSTAAAAATPWRGRASVEAVTVGAAAKAEAPCRVRMKAAPVSCCAAAAAVGRCRLGAPATAVSGCTAAAAATRGPGGIYAQAVSVSVPQD